MDNYMVNTELTGTQEKNIYFGYRYIRLFSKKIFKLPVKPHVVAHTYKPRIWEIGTKGSGIQSHP